MSIVNILDISAVFVAVDNSIFLWIISLLASVKLYTPHFYQTSSISFVIFSYSSSLLNIYHPNLTIMSSYLLTNLLHSFYNGYPHHFSPWRNTFSTMLSMYLHYTISCYRTVVLKLFYFFNKILNLYCWKF